MAAEKSRRSFSEACQRIRLLLNELWIPFHKVNKNWKRKIRNGNTRGLALLLELLTGAGKTSEVLEAASHTKGAPGFDDLTSLRLNCFSNVTKNWTRSSLILLNTTTRYPHFLCCLFNLPASWDDRPLRTSFFTGKKKPNFLLYLMYQVNILLGSQLFHP